MTKDKWRPLRDLQVIVFTSLPNVKDAWKYAGSDNFYFRTYKSDQILNAVLCHAVILACISKALRFNTNPLSKFIVSCKKKLIRSAAARQTPEWHTLCEKHTAVAKFPNAQ